MKTILAKYELGDFFAQYVQEDDHIIELQLLPISHTHTSPADQKSKCDNLIQAYILGDELPSGYSGGCTLRNSGTVEKMRYKGQSSKNNVDGSLQIETYMAHPKGLFTHHLKCNPRNPYVISWTTFMNSSAEPVMLELLSSFSLGGIESLPDSLHDSLWIHRLQSHWSMEAQLRSYPAEELGLEESWANYGVRVLRFGQAGSMPCNGWFPWLLVEDRSIGVHWGCSICHNSSWQIEVYRRDHAIAISGGLADSHVGQWSKIVHPDEVFTTPIAILTTSQGITLDETAERLILNDQKINASEESLPLICNEYCSSWGVPTQDNIANLVSKVKDHGFRHFVIDCGWYASHNTPWGTSMGDYEVSNDLFPDGLKSTADRIRAAGMIPGLWFEPEAVGHDSKAFALTDHLLHRQGFPLSTQLRRFWDLRDPWVRNYLREHVISTIKSCGFGYIKLDYNDTIGPGCDGAESPGEALRLQMDASKEFIAELRQEVPNLVIENCASGGHRMDPLTVSLTDLSSFSDAHECTSIPIIAANLHRAIPPYKSLVWAVLRKDDTAQRIAWSISAGFLGRLCLSGDLAILTPSQWSIVDEGLSFYRLITPIIRKGHTRRFGPEIKRYNTPEGWQGIVRTCDTSCMVVLHRFGGADIDPITIPLPWSCSVPAKVYDVCDAQFTVLDTILTWYPTSPMSSIALYFTKGG